MDFERKQTGDRITAEEWNNIGESATAMSRAASGGGVNLRVGPDGITIRGRQVIHFREPAIVMDGYNVGSVKLNPFDVAQLAWPMQLQDAGDFYDGNPLDERFHQTQRIAEVLVPEDHFFGRFCVAAAEIAPQKAGPVWVSGVCLCRIARAHGLYSASQFYKKPDRADTVKGEKYLQVCDIGAAQILWIMEPLSGETGPVPAVIRFDHRNTSGIGISQMGDSYKRGVVEVMEFDDSVTITELAPGVVKVERG
jgi:hypothetical protein